MPYHKLPSEFVFVPKAFSFRNRGLLFERRRNTFLVFIYIFIQFATPPFMPFCAIPRWLFGSRLVIILTRALCCAAFPPFHASNTSLTVAHVRAQTGLPLLSLTFLSIPLPLGQRLEVKEGSCRDKKEEKTRMICCVSVGGPSTSQIFMVTREHSGPL